MNPKTKRRMNAYVRRLHDYKFYANGPKDKSDKALEDCTNLEIKLKADGVNTDELKARVGV